MAIRSFPIDPPLPLDAPRFRRRLLAWFRSTGRDLPWRHTRDPYAILVSEVMLQQTRVATVIPYYSDWLRRFPDFAALAGADESAVLNAWQGLGYYARARNLHAAAKAVTLRSDEKFPTDIPGIRELPGVGRYIANAIATFAFYQRVPVVEANTARVLSRLLNLELSIDSAPGREAIWNFAASLLPRHDARTYNSALMDLGALICVAGEPKCNNCPVRSCCAAREPARLPVKRPRAPLKKITEQHRFSLQRGRILLEQAQDRWRGMWILPKLDAQSALGFPLHSVKFPFTHHQITLEVFDRGKLLAPSRFLRWFTPGELADIPLPSPHRRALEHLLQTKRQILCSASAAT